MTPRLVLPFASADLIKGPELLKIRAPRQAQTSAGMGRLEHVGARAAQEAEAEVSLRPRLPSLTWIGLGLVVALIVLGGLLSLKVEKATMLMQVDDLVRAADGDARKTQYAVTIYDTHDVDGDVVSVGTPGMVPQEIVLSREGTRLLVPVSRDRRASLVIRAVRDGSRSNQVSFGLRGGRTHWTSRVLGEGQSVVVSLALRR